MKRIFADYLISSGTMGHRALAALGDLNWSSHEPICRLAIMHGLLDPASIERALAQQGTTAADFGRIAVEMNLLNPRQIELLLAGQAVRCCVELLEDLALAGLLPIGEGLQVLAAFMVSPQWPQALLRIPETTA